MRPSSAETSEPAWTKRKMLSMKSSTSWPPSSRKYSAMVRPDRPTRRRGARRLVHLAEHERGLVDDARLFHLEPEVVALARALADAGEHREAAVLGGDVADELLNDDGLAHAGAAEQADLAALDVGREQVDDLDAGLEELVGGVERLEVGGRPVDRPALGAARGRLEVVDGLAQHVRSGGPGSPGRPGPSSARRCRRPRRRAPDRRWRPWPRRAPCCRRGAAALRR